MEPSSSHDGSTLLSAVGVDKRFGALVVLHGVNVEVRRGEILGVVGPNGAGKSTLLDILSGAQAPSEGSVIFGGREVTRSSASARCRMGIGRSHQIPRPFGDMTVLENTLVGAMAGAGLDRRNAGDRSIEVLARFDLLDKANRPAGSLGLLDRKRLELARALASDPSVLLLDEIAAGLTEAETDELVATIAELRAGGMAILWIEHIVRLLTRMAGRMLCLASGRVIAEGAPEAVVSDTAVIEAYLGSAAA
jgi:branched-chain amino acid transport system ATP-binding protein